MRWKKISDAVVRRLPLYLRVLDEASRDGEREPMSSQDLGDRAGVSPALVRKDLAWFGEFGKQGVGYEVAYLKEELRRILNLEQEIKVALVGVGSLGHALARYFRNRLQEDPGFNLNVRALFDSDPGKVGSTVAGLEVHAPDELPRLVPDLGIRIAIIAVPAEIAQAVADQCVAAGVRALLNFAPTKLVVPEDVHLANADLSLEMQRLAYYLEG